MKYTFVLSCCLLAAVVTFAQNAQNGSPADQLPELVLANRILSDQGVLDAYGHVSVRDARNPNHFLMSRSMPPAFVGAPDIIEYDLDGKAVSDQRQSFNERFIHGEIYKQRPDVKSVVHFHAPELVSFSVGNVALKPMIHMAGFLPPVIPIFEIRKAGGMTDMLVRNNELGKALAETVGDKPVALMRGHGAVAVGPSLHIAVGRAYYMMVNARAQIQAIALSGDKVVYLDPMEASKAADQDGFERAWAFWAGKLERQH